MALVIVRLSANIIPEIIAEMNYARSNPREYISRIRTSEYRTSYSAADITETIRYLESTIPCTIPLVSNPYLEKIALEWVNLQGPTGLLGHGDFLGRVRKVGTYKSIAENLLYGFTTARDIVADWIIDQGVQGKGHRENIFNCIYNLVGVAYGPHASYRSMTDAVYARDFKPL